MINQVPSHRVRAWLEEIPGMAALLPDAAVAKSADVRTGRPVPGSKPPTNLDVLDLADRREKAHWTNPATLLDPDRHGVLPYLDSWCRALETTAYDGDIVYGIPPCDVAPIPEKPTIDACCGWLLDHLDWATTLSEWPELADGIRITHRRLRSATADVRDRAGVSVPCSRCGTGRMRHVVGEHPLWVCDQCGHEVSVQAVTLRQAARIVGVSKSKLYPLAKRNLLDKVTDGGKVLYDLGSIRRVVAEAHLRGA